MPSDKGGKSNISVVEQLTACSPAPHPPRGSGPPPSSSRRRVPRIPAPPRRASTRLPAPCCTWLMETFNRMEPTTAGFFVSNIATSHEHSPLVEPVFLFHFADMPRSSGPARISMAQVRTVFNPLPASSHDPSSQPRWWWRCVQCVGFARQSAGAEENGSFCIEFF